VLKKHLICLTANFILVLKAIASVLIFWFIIFTQSCKKSNFTPLSKLDNSQSNSILPVAAKPNIILILGDDVGYEIPAIDGGQECALHKFVARHYVLLHVSSF
jgi:hypothetical protein